MIFLFIFVGLLHVYPDLRFTHELGEDFQGISLMGAGDETFYLSRIAGVVYRDSMRLANEGLYGHQNDPIFQPSLAEVIEGTIGKWFGLEVWQIDIWATFLLPITLCFLIYLLVYNLTDSFNLSILATLAVVLGYYWMTPNFKAILGLYPNYFNRSLFFVRPISPQFHFIPFILSLYLIYKISIKNNYYLVILTGSVVGVLFHMSFYYWTFVYSGLGFLLIIDVVRRKTENLKKYSLIFLISILISIPYWFSFWALNNLPYFSEIFRRSGGIYTHKPIIPIIEIAFLTFLIILSYIFTEKKEQFYYMISFVAGGLICLNQQVITGKTVEPMHWQSYTNKVFIIISFFVCISFMLMWVRKIKYDNKIFSLLKKKSIFYVICLIFLTMGIIQQNNYYSAESNIFRKLQIMAPNLRYIHKETPYDAVILTDPFKRYEESLISVYTKNYLYISDSFFITSSVSDREIEERYFFALNFFGYTVSEAKELFGYMDGGLFRGMQVYKRYGGTPEENNIYIKGLTQRYAKLLNQGPMDLLKKYKVDYVLLAKKSQDRLFSRDKIKRILELEYNDDYYELYKIKDYE